MSPTNNIGTTPVQVAKATNQLIDAGNLQKPLPNKILRGFLSHIITAVGLQSESHGAAHDASFHQQHFATNKLRSSTERTSLSSRSLASHWALALIKSAASAALASSAFCLAFLYAY